MNTTEKLAGVADIYLGQTFREKAEATNSNSGVRLIQIKDIREGEMLGTDILPYAEIEPSKLKVKLTGGEILLPLRGTRTAAMIFRKSHIPEDVTTTNQVAIISPKDSRVKLEFLHWYFNSSIGRKALDAIRTGVTIPNISIKNLSEIIIPLPNTDVQNKIIKLYNAWNSQKAVLHELLSNGEKLADAAFLKIINGD